MRARLFGVLPVYGLLIAFAILLATLLCQRESRRRGLPQDTGLDMILIAIPLAVIGARIYYVIFRWDHYAADPLSALYFWQGGLAIYGGVIGGVLGAFALMRYSRPAETDSPLPESAREELLAADEMVSGLEDDPDDEDDIEYLPSDGEEEEDEEARFDDFLSYFKVQYPDEKMETFRMEDGRRGIRLETENYNAEILPGDRSTLVIGIPMTETRKLKKQIRQINADGGMQCRYDRDRKETVFTLPFQAEDAPEDVSNLLRCVLDYEVPALREKGGDR